MCSCLLADVGGLVDWYLKISRYREPIELESKTVYTCHNFARVPWSTAPSVTINSLCDSRISRSSTERDTLDYCKKYMFFARSGGNMSRGCRWAGCNAYLNLPGNICLQFSCGIRWLVVVILSRRRHEDGSLWITTVWYSPVNAHENSCRSTAANIFTYGRNVLNKCIYDNFVVDLEW